MGYLFDKMGFDHRWKKWMRGCLEDKCYSVLVNGSPIDSIMVTRGLKQGDPLSPLIFTLIGEGLNKLIEKDRDMGNVKSFPVTKGGPMVSPLHFADDTLCFYEAIKEEIFGYKAVLRCFELVSG